MHKGKHILIDCRNVDRGVCLDDQRMLRAMANAAELAGATVVSLVRYRFAEGSPPGFTAIVMLDESHCSVHTYADLGLVAMDVFTCGTTEPLDVLHYIRQEIDLGEVTIREFGRFSTEASELRTPTVASNGVHAETTF